jgi:CSLREA domain-containing protein
LHTRNGIRVGILGLIVAAAICPGVAVAAEFKVDTTADGDDKECLLDCTLREAVVLAGSADQILLPAGNYVLADGELSLNNDTIIGEDARTTFIDGADKSRVLRVIEVQSRVSNVTIRNGNGVGLDPDGLGGGIFIHSGSLFLQNSAVSGNTGTMGAGIAAGGVAQLIGVTVSGNTARTGRLTRGGGIAVSETGGLFLGNSTVSGNTAVDGVGNASQGGGVYTAGTLAIIASTIAGNSAAEGDGLYVITPPTGAATSLQNSLLSHGTGGTCGGPGLGNLSATANVISDDTCQFKDPTNLQSVNPQIGALADNGGPTNTHALLPTSPAIGHAGSCATIDQRLITRVAPCDSGSYEYRAPTLKVVTAVINDSGGTRTPSQFSVHVRTGGADVTGSPQPGTLDGTTYTLDAGSTYNVAADQVAGYTISVSGDCVGGAITLLEGQNRTCTVTANDIAPTLRVITTVVNNSGGTAVPANFSAHVRQNGVEVTGSPQAGVGAPGTLYTLTPGTYAVTADGVSGYAPTGSGACNTAGSVTLALGQSTTCTITVDDIPATLRVVTNVVNNSGGDAERDDFDAHVKRNGADVANSPQPGVAAPGTAYTLAAGTYALSADGESGYSAAFSTACAGGTIVLALAQEATCTITLEDGAATLNVATRVVNDDGGTAGADAFSVSVLLGDDDVPSSPQPGSENGTPYTLNAATFTVAADGVPGYAFSVTGDCAQDGSITLPLDAERACTVTADDVAPRLTVVTQVVNDHGGVAAQSSFAVHVKRGATDVSGSPQPGSGSGTPYTLTAGTHVISADPVGGYSSAISGDCAGDGSITLNVGDNRTCTVAANDDPPPVRAQSSAQLPPPQPGKNVNALPKSGTVRVKLPGTSAFVDLDEAQQLPVGTIVDATKGHVTLIAAADDSGGTATAEFWAGIFRIGQSRGDAPTTILTLVEKLSCPKAGKASAAAKKKKKRRLWGDGSGKFRTKGKHSAATVVGTRWLVEDRCKSTLTRVVRGRVSVRDFVKKKTVTVRAGKKYVAKARRR